MAVDRDAVGTTHYDVLGVPADADRQAIARAYRAAMRRLHPDASGAVDAEVVDELAAVQEAWRVLQDAEARAAYDGELAGPADVWADLGWGVAVGDPTPDAPASAPARSDRDPWPDDSEGSSEPWRTPFAPGAVPIPEPPPPSGPPRRGVVDWLLVAAGVLLAATTVVLAIRARGELVGTAAFPGVSITRAATFIGVGTAAVPPLWKESFRLEKGTPERAAGFFLGVFMSLGLLAAPWVLGLPAALLGWSGAGTLLAVVGAFLRRRSVVRRAAAADVARLTTYHRSAEWNRVREALREPGSRVEESRGVPNLDEPNRVLTVDPTTKEEHRRNLDVGLPRGGWVVVDESGAPLCTAPPGALEAWLAALGHGPDER